VDVNASGAVRIAGSINFKEKYALDFPRVQLVHSASGRITTRAGLDLLGVVARAGTGGCRGSKAACISGAPHAKGRGRARRYYQRRLDGAPPNGVAQSPTAAGRIISGACWRSRAVGHRGNRRPTDELREKAQENGERYAVRTAWSV